VINRPARDALLLHHAIVDVGDRGDSGAGRDAGARGSGSHGNSGSHAKDELRYELLISRLVRLHWDRGLLVRVKRAYSDKYGRALEEDLEDATRGDLREFVWELART
jgi:hypothetical protein